MFSHNSGCTDDRINKIKVVGISHSCNEVKIFRRLKKVSLLRVLKTIIWKLTNIITSPSVTI